MREHLGASVTILESTPHAGGMLRTLHTDDGLPYEYGPRVLSVFRGTQSGLDFVSRFLDLEKRDIYQGTRLQPGYPVLPFPLDLKSLNVIPEGNEICNEMARLRGSIPDETSLRTYLESTVGPTLTRLAFEGFNRKFWGRELDELPADWGKLRRLETIANEGSYRLPSLAPHFYPKGGFNTLFPQMLDEVQVHYNAQVQSIEATPNGPMVHCSDRSFQSDLVISTAAIDHLLGLKYGQLEWKGYRLELEAKTEPTLGNAPDGVPFAWVYTPWQETPVCRTTDFGVIHHGQNKRGNAVVAREIPDDSVKMYPVSWETERFELYLKAAARIKGFIPLGRLGLYKYVTIDSTFAMTERLIDELSGYAEANENQRFGMLKRIRGDWSN